MTFKEFVRDYLEEGKRVLDSINIDEIESAVDLIWEAYRKERKILIFGNGGSAAIAAHFASDLNSTTIGHRKDFKGRRFKALALTTNISELTAWANDVGFEKIFSGPLENLVEEDDLVIGISSSGNSQNVIEVVELAKKKGAKTAGLTGMGGGKLKEVADECLVVDSDHYGQVEGTHSVLCHLITFYFLIREYSAAPSAGMKRKRKDDRARAQETPSLRARGGRHFVDKLKKKG